MSYRYIRMELRQIKAFVEVAMNGSYARAAATFGIAQSVLSRQVSALERSIGGRLFHRTGRGVLLSELGERVLPRARALLDDAIAFEQAAVGTLDQPTGDVILGVVPVASRSLVAALAGRSREAYPGIRLRVLEAYSGQVEEWLATGRVDIAIYNRYRRGRVPKAEPLLRADMHLIMRGDKPTARRHEIGLRTLASVPLAMPVRPNSLTSTLMALAASQHFTLDIKLEVGSTPLIKEAILASDLATIAAAQVFRQELETGEFRAVRIIRPAIQQTTWMSVSSQRPISAAARAVARLISELAARQRTASRSKPHAKS